MDYALCFNQECALKEQCMRYQLGLQATAHRTQGAAVYPSAWKDGTCSSFSTNGEVEMAWGFDGLYKLLSPDMATVARRSLRKHLSAGASTYYRFHHGERLLSPAKQQEIIDFVSQFGPVGEKPFDHYLTAYDFT
jgi:hypothetical protein